MARLFVPNFGFEDEIVGRDLSRAASAATRGLTGCWAALLDPSAAPATHELDFAVALNSTLEGKTDKHKNPHQEASLA